MNDTLIISLIGFVATLLPIFGVVIKVNSTLTKLNISIECLSKQMEDSGKDRQTIHLTLNNHETRISLLEGRESK